MTKTHLQGVIKTLTKGNYIPHVTLRLLRHTFAPIRRGNRKRGKHTGFVTLKRSIGRSGQRIEISTQTCPFMRLFK